MLTSQDVRNTIRLPQQEPGVSLHLLVANDKTFTFAYKPQNWPIENAVREGFLPPIHEIHDWPEILRDDNFFLVLGSREGLELLDRANHIAIDATHAVCDVS